MLSTQAVTSHTLELLKRIQSIRQLEAFRLVGGTSLALQLGHRLSIDLDLFSYQSPVPGNIQSVLMQHGMKVENISLSERIKILKIDGIKVDFVDYPYNWLNNTLLFENIRLASMEDIAAMKLSAITNRGTKKDFVDIYYLLSHISLQEMLRLYHQKYPEASDFLLYKSLIYFEDAELEPMPKMLQPLSWEEVKSRIVEISEKEFL